MYKPQFSYQQPPMGGQRGFIPYTGPVPPPPPPYLIQKKDLKKDDSEPYYGPRDETFKNMIKKLLSFGRLKDKYINLLLEEDSFEIYKTVFTHQSVDSKNNYEFYETLGDVTINKISVWYIPPIVRWALLRNVDGL